MMNVSVFYSMDSLLMFSIKMMKFAVLKNTFKCLVECGFSVAMDTMEPAVVSSLKLYSV